MEDKRKNNEREMIGIMPVVTTAANAMYQQHLIDVSKESVIGYETIGTIKTLNAASQISADYPNLSILTSNVVLESDMARLINTKTYYKNVLAIDVRVTKTIAVPEKKWNGSDEDIRQLIRSDIENGEELYIAGSWDGQFQREEKYDKDNKLVGLSVLVSYKRSFTKDQMKEAMPAEYESSYKDKFDWHNPSGDDSIPETVSQEANSFFPTIDFDGEHFDRTNLKKIGVVVYKMFMDPSEGNKINFEPVEAYAGSLCKTDRDPNTGATTFIDTIINSQSKYINFFSNCFNTAADRKYYANDLDMLVMQPGAAHQKEATVEIKYIRDFQTVLKDLCELAQVDFKDVDNIGSIQVRTDVLQEQLVKY